MTNRRHHSGTDEPPERDPSPDPWASIGADPDAGDFWGDTPDWSATASTSRRSGRSRIGAGTDDVVDPTPIGAERPPTERVGLVGGLRQAWNGLLNNGADATREHRRLDLTATSVPFDQSDDVPAIDRDTHDARTAIAVPGAANTAAQVDPSSVDDIERRWIAEAAAAVTPDDRRPIDPLLVRLGAVVIVACLVIPMLIAVLGSSDSFDDRAGAIASASPEIDIVTFPTPSENDLEPARSEPTPTVLDPASLPPAIPVNTDAPTADTAADDVTIPTATASPTTVDSSTAVSAELSPGEGDTRDASDASLDDVSAPAVAETPAARVDPPVCPVPYTVVAGDFWLRLVDAAEVSLADLLAVNGATVDTPLYAGAEICLPEGATTPAPPTTTAPTTAAPTPVPATTAAPTTTTAPETTTTTTTTVAPVSEPAGPEDIKQIIRDVWPDELEDRALEIAFRESRFVPTAKNFCCYGLFQIYWEVHDVWLADLGVTSASQLYDPETNARAALALYERAGGWGPWGF